MSKKFFIDPDIRRASTLPSSFYKDRNVFEKIKEKVFQKSWQFIGDEHLVKVPKYAHPFVLLDGYMTAPIIPNITFIVSLILNKKSHHTLTRMN